MQRGTAYLLSPEARTSPVYRKALKSEASQTVLTNVFTGLPARAIATRMVREIGPMSKLVPDFPRNWLFNSAWCRLGGEGSNRLQACLVWSIGSSGA